MDSLNPAELFVPEIRAALAARKLPELKATIAELNPIDLAYVFKDFAPAEQVLLLRLLNPRAALIVFEELELLQQEYILHHLDDEHLSSLIGDLSSQSLRRLVRKVPSSTWKKMESHLRQGQRDLVTSMPLYPPQTVGVLMQTDVAPLKPEMTVREAQEFLRAKWRVRDEQIVNALYVTDTAGRPIGALSLRRLVASPLETHISELMIPAASIRIRATMDQEDASKLFSHYRLLSAPVVDDDNRLVGVISAGEMLRVQEDEATEDIHKMGAMDGLDEPYFKISFLRMIKKRGTWLCVLFVGEMLTATAMGFFEKEISKAVVLALFIPLIISSGGNSGSQAATLIVRAMALREVTFKDWWRVMNREILAGLALGCILGTIGFFRIYLWSQFSPIYGPHYVRVALTVACSLVLVVLWGSLSGSMLPIGLRKLGLDPAVVSAPFVATLVDVTGLVIYFMTGLFILRGTLL